MDKLDCLREKIKAYAGGKRLAHILSVEKETLSLAALFGLDATETEKLRCAALLHDITKQKKTAEQLALYDELSLPDAGPDSLFPGVMHAKTAAALIPRDFPELAEPEIVEAVRWHATGRAGMALTEKLLYLADYIEPARAFDDCIRLRKYFYDGIEKGTEPERLLRHLDKTLILAFDITVGLLIKEGEMICPDTVEARNYLLRADKRHSAG